MVSVPNVELFAASIVKLRERFGGADGATVLSSSESADARRVAPDGADKFSGPGAPEPLRDAGDERALRVGEHEVGRVVVRVLRVAARHAAHAGRRSRTPCGRRSARSSSARDRRREGRALAQQVADAVCVRRRSRQRRAGWPTRWLRRSPSRRRHVLIVLDVGGHRQVAGRRARPAVVGERVGRADKQVVAARRNDRAVRDGAERAPACRAQVRAHLEDAVAGRGVRGCDRQRRVRVVVELDEVVARPAGAGGPQLRDEERARGVVACVIVPVACASWMVPETRAGDVQQQRLVRLGRVCVGADRDGNGRDLRAGRDDSRAARPSRSPSCRRTRRRPWPGWRRRRRSRS